MSSDTDFFFLKLECGCIYFERWYDEKEDKSLLEIEEFIKQFGLRNYEFCLLISAILGNDSIKKCRQRESFQRVIINESKTCVSPIHYLRGPTEVKNFEKAKEHYKTCSSSPFPRYSNVPEWCLRNASRDVSRHSCLAS